MPVVLIGCGPFSLSGPVQFSRKQYVTLWELTFYWWVEPNQGHNQGHKQETQPVESNQLTDFILDSEWMS